MSIERDICKAIDIISSRAISTANHGTTVLATVVECLNPFNGKYRIKYQSNNFIAYNNNINTFYDAETPVYIFLKNGQLDEELIILGPAHGRNNNSFYGIKADFSLFDIQDLFQGGFIWEKTDTTIKATPCYMGIPVSKIELSNFKFYWRGSTDGGDNWTDLSKMNGERISGTNEIQIGDYTFFECEVVMDNFKIIRTIDINNIDA